MTCENIRNSNFNIHSFIWTIPITLCIICGCFCALISELCNCNRGLKIFTISSLQEKFADPFCNLCYLILCLVRGWLWSEEVLDGLRDPAHRLFGYQVAVGCQVCKLAPVVHCFLVCSDREVTTDAPLACSILLFSWHREKNNPKGKILWERRDRFRNPQYLFDFIFLSRALPLTKIFVPPMYIKYRDAFRYTNNWGIRLYHLLFVSISVL